MKLFIPLLLFITTTACCQPLVYKKYIVYVELLGAGDPYSLNVEYLIRPNHSLRLGGCWFPEKWRLDGVQERTYLNLPLTYQYLIGKNNHKLECSGGILNTYTIYSKFPNHLQITPQFALAYRFQKNTGGLFFRSGLHLFVPVYLSIDRYETLFYSGNHWRLWPGIAAGWQF
ncbi:MAG: hypothetical protein V4651_04070 [Bacteroidota bacterium]